MLSVASFHLIKKPRLRKEQTIQNNNTIATIPYLNSGPFAYQLTSRPLSYCSGSVYCESMKNIRQQKRFYSLSDYQSKYSNKCGPIRTKQTRTYPLAKLYSTNVNENRKLTNVQKLRLSVLSLVVITKYQPIKEQNGSSSDWRNLIENASRQIF